MIHLSASDPLYAEINFILTIRAQWMNPACFFDLCGMSEVERLAFVALLDKELAKMFEELTR